MFVGLFIFYVSNYNLVARPLITNAVGSLQKWNYTVLNNYRIVLERIVTVNCNNSVSDVRCAVHCYENSALKNVT